MSLDPKRVEATFAAALERPADEREAYLRQACDGDDVLRERVAGLLRAHAQASGFLNEPVAAETQGVTRSQPGDDLSFLAPPQRPGSLGRLGHYEILERIGQGGFGTVFRAFDEKLHRVVAVKVLGPQLAASANARQRFEREARAAAAVVHEHVVTIHAVEDQPVPYLVMQFVAGQSLQDKIGKTGALTLKETLRIGTQIAEGLAAAHKQGLVHRDIKPATILLENGVERVKITDFGLARAVDDASLTASGVISGTPLYMAPEQARGESVDHRADLFSLGSVLYAMGTGHPPFRASGTLAVLMRVAEDTPRPMREGNPEIPEWLESLVARLHAKAPADRPGSAREVADVLAERLAQVQQGRPATNVPLARPVPRPAGGPTAMSGLQILTAGAWFLLLLSLFAVGFSLLTIPLAERTPLGDTLAPLFLVVFLVLLVWTILQLKCGARFPWLLWVYRATMLLAGVAGLAVLLSPHLTRYDGPATLTLESPLPEGMSVNVARREDDGRSVGVGGLVADPLVVRPGAYVFYPQYKGEPLDPFRVELKPGQKFAYQVPPLPGDDLNAQWDGGFDWGTIRLEPITGGFGGTYSDTYNGKPGYLALAKINPREYRGFWGQSDGKRHGTLQVWLGNTRNELKTTWAALDKGGGTGRGVWKRTSIAAPMQYPFALPKPPGLSGVWSGTWFNSEGQTGDEKLDLKQDDGGNLNGSWDSGSHPIAGGYSDKTRARWQTEHEGRHYDVECRSVSENNEALILSYVATYRTKGGSYTRMALVRRETKP